MLRIVNRCPLAVVVAAALFLACLAAPSAFAQDPLRRAGLVDVQSVAPSIRLDVRYATSNNFTGAVVPGYCEPRALLLRGRALALARVQRALRRRELALKVLDAYRPARASRSFVRWAQRAKRAALVEQGYIALKSNHNLGSTIDLTLVRLSTGEELDMGTAFDAFTPRSNTTRVSGTPLRNRLTLKNAMEDQGFVNYSREWWHFDSEQPGTRRLDLPIGCGR